jgi:hypothetical protein
MMRSIAVWLSFFILLACCPASFAQGAAQAEGGIKQTVPPSATDTESENILEYINLLRSNVGQQKAEIMGSMMALDADQAAKFWPIYNEYDGQLKKVNDLRVANMQEYARNYDRMTDAKADELIHNALKYRRQRSDLLAKYYERVKASLGPVQAARFVQIEEQLLTIIDLKIASALPVMGQGL